MVTTWLNRFVVSSREVMQWCNSTGPSNRRMGRHIMEAGYDIASKRCANLYMQVQVLSLSGAIMRVGTLIKESSRCRYFRDTKPEVA